MKIISKFLTQNFMLEIEEKFCKEHDFLDLNDKTFPPIFDEYLIKNIIRFETWFVVAPSWFYSCRDITEIKCVNDFSCAT